MVPWNARVEQRDVTTVTAAGGQADIVDTTQLIDLLRPKLVLARLGCRMLTDLMGQSFGLPRKSAVATFTTTAEGAAGNASSLAIGKRQTIWPSMKAVYSDMTRKTVKALGGDLGQRFLVDDLLTGLAVEIERVAVNGTGTNDEPVGLFQNAAIGSDSLGANGAAPTWAALCSLEATIGNANADVGRMGVLTSPNGRKVLRQTLRGSTTLPLWHENRVLDYPAEVSTNVPSNITHGTGNNLTALCLGNFDDLVVGMWPVVLIVNPYALSSSGGLRVTCMCEFGTAVRQEASFRILCDINPS
jgi:HK97 family phage major capsid protein